MASTTIHHLAYKMSVDARQFTEGMTLTRKELRLAQKTMDGTRTPAQKLEKELIDLNKLYRAGAIDSQAYTTRLKQMESQFSQTGQGASMMTGLLTGKAGALVKVAATVGVAIAALKTGLNTIQRVMDATNEQYRLLDRLAKKSDEIGIDPRQLMRLERITELTSTFTADQLDTALRKMTVRVSQAAAGTGEAVATLQELNLNAEYLNTLSPDEQFLAISDALGSVTNEGDQARLVMKLFDDEAIALVNTLRLGSEEILAQTEHIKGYTREQLAGVEQANDAWTTFNNTMGDTFGMLAVEFAPEIKGMAESLTELMKSDAFAEMLRSAMSVAEQLFPLINGTIDKIEWVLQKSNELGYAAYHVAEAGPLLAKSDNVVDSVVRDYRRSGGGGFNSDLQRQQLDETRRTNALLGGRDDVAINVVGGL